MRFKNRTGKVWKRKSERDQARWDAIDYGAPESKYKRQLLRQSINEEEAMLTDFDEIMENREVDEDLDTVTPVERRCAVCGEYVYIPWGRTALCESCEEHFYG